jgi:hypothetical protein
MNFNNKNMKLYVCTICDYKFDSIQKLQKHMQRKNKCSPQQDKYKCNICYKQFNQKSHYERHMNRKNQCKSSITNELQQSITNEIQQSITNELQQFKDDIMRTLSKNIKLSQNKTHNLENLHNNNTENSHNTNNSHNTQNNTMQNMTNACLIQYVVQQYPNAKNIEDCIKIENIPKATLVECEDLYFTDGAMKIFKGLCDLGEENRPIHCTDASRCNYIYKTNDVWKIDVGGEEIRNYFFPVIQEAYTQVHKKRIKDNPGNSTIIGNYLTEMTGTNVKKICQKTLKRLSNSFLAKNSKNSKLIKMQQ